MDRAKSFLKKKDLDSAIAACTEAIRLNSELAEAYFYRGRAYHEKHNFEDAIVDFTETIRLKPKLANGYVWRGMAHQSSGRLSKAVEDYTEAIRLDPRSVEGYHNRANAYLKGREFDKAVSDYTDAIRLDPRYAPAYLYRGWAFGRKGNVDKEIADYNNAIRLDPKDPRSYYSRGSAFSRKGDQDRAIADYTEAIRLNPKDARAYHCRGCAHRKKGHLIHAIADFTAAIGLDPQNTHVYYNRGYTYGQRGDAENAITDYTEAIRLDPKYANAYLNRGALRTIQGRSGLAIVDLDKAVELAPDNPIAYLTRSVCKSAQGNRESAIRDCDTAIRLKPDSPCAYEVRGVLWIVLGQYDRGMADIQTAIRLNPADVAASFETWSKTFLDESALQHGRQQVRRMIQDRPAMGTYDDREQVLYEWAARKFAGEDLGRRIFWDPSEPPRGIGGANRSSATDGPAVIMVNGKSSASAARGEDGSFEEQWSHAVFELYNTANDKECDRLWNGVADGTVSKNEVLAGMIEIESHAAEKTRSFYIHVFLPWARKYRVPTRPILWFLALRSDPKENIIRQHIAEGGTYWRHYENAHDLLVLKSLVKKRDYQKALDHAATIRERAETPAERAIICRCNAQCLLELGRFLPAVENYTAVIQFDPRDVGAYMGRAVAHAKLRDTGRAIADCSEAIRLMPSNSEPYRLRGEIYAAAGNKDHAEADFAMAEKLPSLGEERRKEAAKVPLQESAPIEASCH